MENWRVRQRRRDEAWREKVMALPTVALRHHAGIAPVDAGAARVCASVGPEGQLIALWSPPAGASGVQSSTTQPEPADPLAPPPVLVRATVHAPGPAALARFEVSLAYPKLQPLPGDRLLVVGARCQWRPEGPDRNAVIYDADGHVLAAETVGDGVEHVLASGNGDVWVGYFDEGVYGNLGWGDVDGPPPIGAPGLIRFTPDLRPDWRFPSHVDRPWGAISDCEALNVDGETAWVSYYTDFPIVRIRAGEVAVWRNDVARARALAVSGSRVGLFGQPGPDGDRIVVGDLADHEFHGTGEYRAVLPDGKPLPPRAQVIGRGADLHLITGEDWYRLDLEQISARPGGHSSRRL